MSEQHSLNPFEHTGAAENADTTQNAAEQLIQSLNADQLATSSKHDTTATKNESGAGGAASNPHFSEHETPVPKEEEKATACPFSGAKAPSADGHHCPAMACGGPFTSESEQSVDPKVASSLWRVLTWKNTSCSLSSLLSILALFFVPSWINIPRLFFRTIRYVLLITSIIEFGGQFASSGRRGVLSPFRTKYVTCNTKAIDCFVNCTVDIANVLLIQFQRVLFAECPLLTFAVAIGSFIEYFLSGFLSYRGLFIWNIIFAFTLPKLYEMNEASIKRMISSLEQQQNKLKHDAASATSSQK
ncbi:reticulon-like protein [Schizosaccharomyces cryophilus OY26]|uniref:Reticulon-like protein n=1 Tax=Schizosaccharomyces cryophilus (strain OY26 / ATCC MYA-4695 / CBS 11777 / NBRC 106824 / NRRL Y48691) TaxID=653667 RepID=S9VT89_SCHCR|nr:reticulon-like protein [Schizosaccharomyces cryophilus OY26]EPY49315.1 reticulon-like protein [Schizosaccharomyces cryophilus OY26]